MATYSGFYFICVWNRNTKHGTIKGKTHGCVLSKKTYTKKPGKTRRHLCHYILCWQTRCCICYYYYFCKTCCKTRSCLSYSRFQKHAAASYKRLNKNKSKAQLQDSLSLSFCSSVQHGKICIQQMFILWWIKRVISPQCSE